jgi:predicted metal-binding protein
MKKNDLKKYCDHALAKGITGVKVIQPSSVVTEPWVCLKCKFGCGGYGYNYCCPPHSLKSEETRKILDSYHRAILFHIEALYSSDREKCLRKHRQMLREMEGDMFKDGYYKVFVFLIGPCDLCSECAILSDNPCTDRNSARPSMESCGIDVFQTARNNGFTINTLSEVEETRNDFCLMLVD